MENYHNIIALLLIGVALIGIVVLHNRAPKIDEGNKDIYPDDFTSIDDDRGGE